MTLRRKSFAYARRTRRGTTVLTLTALAAALLTGCGSSGHAKASSPTATSPVPSPSASVDPQAAMKAGVLSAYKGFWDVQVKAYSTGSLDGLGPNQYALGQAYYDIKAALAAYKEQHLVVRGRPILSPEVAALNITKKPYSATIKDCIDTSNFLPVDATTGKPAKLTSNVHRHPWTFTASYDNVQWRIMTDKIDRTRTC